MATNPTDRAPQEATTLAGRVNDVVALMEAAGLEVGPVSLLLMRDIAAALAAPAEPREPERCAFCGCYRSAHGTIFQADHAKTGACLVEDCGCLMFRAAPAADLEARVRRLEATLDQAAEWFEEYAAIHERKGDEDKRARNEIRAQYCRNVAGYPVATPAPTPQGEP